MLSGGEGGEGDFGGDEPAEAPAAPAEAASQATMAARAETAAAPAAAAMPHGSDSDGVVAGSATPRCAALPTPGTVKGRWSNTLNRLGSLRLRVSAAAADKAGEDVFVPNGLLSIGTPIHAYKRDSGSGLVYVAVTGTSIAGWTKEEYLQLAPRPAQVICSGFTLGKPCQLSSWSKHVAAQPLCHGSGFCFHHQKQSRASALASPPSASPRGSLHPIPQSHREQQQQLQHRQVAAAQAAAKQLPATSMPVLSPHPHALSSPLIAPSHCALFPVLTAAAACLAVGGFASRGAKCAGWLQPVDAAAAPSQAGRHGSSARGIGQRGRGHRAPPRHGQPSGRPPRAEAAGGGASR